MNTALEKQLIGKAKVKNFKLTFDQPYVLTNNKTSAIYFEKGVVCHMANDNARYTILVKGYTNITNKDTHKIYNEIETKEIISKELSTDRQSLAAKNGTHP